MSQLKPHLTGRFADILERDTRKRCPGIQTFHGVGVVSTRRLVALFTDREGRVLSVIYGVNRTATPEWIAQKHDFILKAEPATAKHLALINLKITVSPIVS